MMRIKINENFKEFLEKRSEAIKKLTGNEYENQCLALAQVALHGFPDEVKKIVSDHGLNSKIEKMTKMTTEYLSKSNISYNLYPDVGVLQIVEPSEIKNHKFIPFKRILKTEFLISEGSLEFPLLVGILQTKAFLEAVQLYCVILKKLGS